MDPELQVSLLGHFQVRYGSHAITTITSSRLQTLFVYLILHRDAPVSRQELAFLFWPETSESQARTNLRNLIHQLRQSFPFFDAFIAVDTQSLGWRKDVSYTLDVATFEHCLELKPGTPIHRESLEQAVQIYTGDLMPDCYEDWIAPTRERLHRAFLFTLEALATITEEAREYSSALEYARRLVIVDPLNTSANYRIIRLHALIGDRAAALKAYQRYARLLSRELGVEPDEEMQALYNQLKQARTTAQNRVINAYTPLIGRQSEWSRLLAFFKDKAWEQASARSGVQIIFISGEAGIGKTRLVEELEHWAAAQGILTASAFCYPAEGNLPYAPVMSWLRAHPLPRLEKHWLAEIARLLPEVRQKNSLPKVEPLREAWQRQHLFEALALALLSGKQPTSKLFILEDIHWCDQDTLEWLHYLLRRNMHKVGQQPRLLIVATLRSGEIAAGVAMDSTSEHPLVHLQTTLRAEGKYTQIDLQPLNQSDTYTLASLIHHQIFGQNLSAEAAGEIYREAEGNPLFAVEMARLGPEMPCTEPPCGDWLEASERIQAVLSRRVEQISPATREITSLAATIGRSFSLEMLHQACQAPEDKVILAIDELLQRRIIREFSSESYDFTHDLLRQAAFAGMSTAHRRLLHRKVAEAYQNLNPNERGAHNAEIASHYEQAGLALPAIQHFRLAADSAAAVFANADAQRYLRRALDLAETGGMGKSESVSPEEITCLLERLGDLLALDGKYPQAQEYYERALTQPFSANGLWQAKMYRKISDGLVPQYQLALAHSALDRAEQALGMVDVSGTLPERQEWLQVQLARIQLFYWESRPAQMEPLIRKILVAVEMNGRTDQQVTLLSLQYMSRHRRERYRLSAETVEIGRRRLAFTETLNNPYELAVAQFQYGFGLLWHGDLSTAREWLIKGMDGLERVGARIWQVRALAYLSITDRKLEKLEAVREETGQLLTFSRTIGDLTYYGMGLANQGWLAWRQGDPAQARCLCEEANQVWAKSGSSVFHCLSNWVLLAIAVENANLAQAVPLAQALLDPDPFYQPVPPQAGELLAQALLFAQNQNHATALTYFSQALDAARTAREL